VKHLSTYAHRGISQLPLAQALVSTLERCRTHLRWRWNTTSTYCAAIAGFFRRASQYCGAAFPDVILKDSCIWTDFLRRVSGEKRSEKVDRTKAVERDDLLRAISNCPDDIALVALLQWCSCARPGAIFHLRLDQVSLVGQQLTVDFRRHKTRHWTGEFVLCTKIPAAFAPRLQDYLARRTLSSLPFLFHDGTSPLSDVREMPRACQRLASAVG